MVHHELVLILNELSLNPAPPSSHVGRQWMKNLQETAARAIERGFRDALVITQGVLSAPLGPSYSFSHWLDDAEVELELRQAVTSWVTWGSFADDLYLEECADRVEVTYAGELGVGLGLALVRDHAVVSVGVAPWNHEDDELGVLVHRWSKPSGPVDKTAAVVRNLHCPAAVERRLRWIAARCCVKPRYENPGTHDPTSGNFRGGGTMTTVLPKDAEEVYETAIPSDLRDGLSSWWGQSVDGYLYRYQASWPGREPVAHWNGTTNPASARAIVDGDVPETIRDVFPDRRG